MDVMLIGYLSIFIVTFLTVHNNLTTAILSLLQEGEEF